MKSLSSQGRAALGRLFLEMFLSGSYPSLCSMCMVDAHRRLYGQQMALMMTLSGLRDLELFVNIFDEEKKKETKGLGKVKEGDRRQGERLRFIRAALLRDLPQSSASPLSRGNVSWVHSHCSSKIP